MAQAAISPALRGWEGPVGREEAGQRGCNARPMSREEQPFRATHRAGGDVEQPIWFITPEAQGKALPAHAMYQRPDGASWQLWSCHQLRGTRLILVSVAAVRNLPPPVTHFKTMN